VLGTFERMVSNATLKAELEKVGFSDVKVTGTSSIRYVVAAWHRADQDREIPRQVHEIIEMEPIEVVPSPIKFPTPPDVPVPKIEPLTPPKKPWWKLW
jgi:hypothetical protein